MTINYYLLAVAEHALTNNHEVDCR